tara:strand:+ start:233819 stop:235438 length:1620 start_codon:yes stop_codon:yes gene_type:complete
LTSLLVAGVVEVIGIGALLPLLNIVLNITPSEDNVLTQAITTIFSTLGIEQSFQNLLLIIVVTITLKATIIFQALKTVAYIAIDITHDLRQKFIRAIMKAEWGYYSALDVGKSANAIATESDYAGQFCTIMGKTLSSAIQAGIYISIAFTIDWKISLAAIIMGGFLAFTLKFLVRMARDAGNRMANALNQLLSRLNESLSGAKPIKAMGEEERYIDLLSADTQDLQEARKGLALSALLLNLIHEPMLVLLMAVGLFWAYTYANYPMSELFMMAFLFNRLLSQVNMVQNHYQKTSVFEGAVNAILEKTQIASEHVEPVFGAKSVKLEKEIRLDNITLAYDDENILSDFTNKIPAKKMTVVFGPSGSGKSTLLDNVLGLLSPKKGMIYIDGVPLCDIDIQQWRRKVGYVPQETFLFHDTIFKNVTLGDTNITQERIIEALKITNAWGFIQKLDGGLHHIVGERGGKLSGGQRQRIALARALVRNPSVLILDEATSGLDKANEKSIINALKGMVPNITIIAISHDPKILDIADHVIRLEDHS